MLAMLFLLFDYSKINLQFEESRLLLGQNMSITDFVRIKANVSSFDSISFQFRKLYPRGFRYF